MSAQMGGPIIGHFYAYDTQSSAQLGHTIMGKIIDPEDDILSAHTVVNYTLYGTGWNGTGYYVMGKIIDPEDDILSLADGDLVDVTGL